MPFLRFISHPAAAIFLLLTLAACSDSDKNAVPKNAAVPVTTAISHEADTPVIIEATGRVEASETVGIRARISGTLEKVHFQEGQAVKAGQLLYTIDSRPYQAILHNRQAALAKSKAELAHAQGELARYRSAIKKGLVSQEEAETAAVNAASMAATVLADQAAVESAKLDLDYCQLVAPFAGITGARQNDPGDLVTANAATPLVTINAIRPVHIVFSLPGKYLADLRNQSLSHPTAKPLTVALYPQSAAGPPFHGEIFFMDNTVGAATGAILLKARYANQQDELWPGQMLRLTIRVRTIPKAVRVPSQAVHVGQREMYVFVVKDDNTVEYRKVEAGEQYQNETVITSGLAAGEKVVTNGQMQLHDGAAILEREEKATAEASVPAGGNP